MQLKSEWMDQVRSQLKIGIPELNEVQPQVVRQYLTSLDKEVNCLYYRSPDDPARATIVYADDEGRLLGEFTTK